MDEIFINTIREYGLYDKIWQAFAVFLPVRSVGVQVRRLILHTSIEALWDVCIDPFRIFETDVDINIRTLHS